MTVDDLYLEKVTGIFIPCWLGVIYLNSRAESAEPCEHLGSPCYSHITIYHETLQL